MNSMENARYLRKALLDTGKVRLCNCGCGGLGLGGVSVEWKGAWFGWEQVS